MPWKSDLRVHQIKFKGLVLSVMKIVWVLGHIKGMRVLVLRKSDTIIEIN